MEVGEDLEGLLGDQVRCLHFHHQDALRLLILLLDLVDRLPDSAEHFTQLLEVVGGL